MQGPSPGGKGYQSEELTYRRENKEREMIKVIVLKASQCSISVNKFSIEKDIHFIDIQFRILNIKNQ